jgi:hypothetical protein
MVLIITPAAAFILDDQVPPQFFLYCRSRIETHPVFYRHPHENPFQGKKLDFAMILPLPNVPLNGREMNFV